MKRYVYSLTLIAGSVWGNFELRNHETTPIAITVMQPAREERMQDGSTRYAPVLQVAQEISGAHGSAISAATLAVDVRYPIYLKIASPRQVIEPMYTFTPGKNLFLAFEKGVLRPQKGIFGKSQSGSSLKNNVQQKDILKLNDKERTLIMQQIQDNEIARELNVPKSEPKKPAGNNWVRGY